MEDTMQAIPDSARHFGWQPSMPLRGDGTAAVAGTALERAVRPMLERLAGAVGRVASAVWRWHVINRDIRKLSQLDDHLLRDIGLHRSAIVTSVHRRVAEIERSGRYPYL
jgi:uncharacterized protein YjiS (DUF1127 family)